MKHLYATCGGITFLFIALFSFNTSKAQCNCTGGLPATALSYYVVVPPTQSSNTLFSFPKFDPSIGILSCIRFHDTISVAVTTFVKNTDTTEGHDYVFQTTITDAVSGPRNSGPFNWLAHIRTQNQPYGPVYLEKDTMPRYPNDSISFGPDTLINNAFNSSVPPDMAPFIGGSGNVDFSTGLSGGVIATFGGVNYTGGILSNAWGRFRLTYYWCPNAVLSINIGNFTAYKKDDNVVMEWLSQNAEFVEGYTVEFSTDGKEFSPITVLPGDHKASSRYSYRYPAANAGTGYIYVRVKQTDAKGKTSYTAIRTVALSNKMPVKITTYPNPAPSTKGVTLSFDRLINGNYNLQVVSMAGEVILNKNMKLSNTNTIPVEWTSRPAPGIYLAKVVNKADLQQQIVRIVVQ
jgi:hypothetical protein